MRRAENQPIGDLTLYAGIFLKTWTIPDAWTMVPQHSHEFPHITLLVSGSIRAWRDGDSLGDFHAPATLKIGAGTSHKFLSLTPGVVLACVHAVGDAGDVAVRAEHVLELED